MKNILYLFIFCLSMLMFPIYTYGQNNTHILNGVVVDKDSEPIIGATVQIKGTSKGIITDLDGKFSINVTNSSILIISYVGMQSQTLKVNNRKSIKIVMLEDNKVLDDVVVIGYGAVKKKELTGAVAQVKGEEITRMLTPDIGDALQGQIAGVNVTAESGAPGQSSQILIRGISSVTGQNTPLYVIDGVPQEGDPRISPNEVETIDVLKDAASCAIYGTRGSAGVILITTKRGKEGAAIVSLNSTFGTQFLKEAIPLMSAYDQAYYSMIYLRNTQNIYDDVAKLELGDRPNYFNNNTDLRDILFKKGLVPTQNYDLNFSGGKNGMTYNVMAGYFNQSGIVINSDFKRFNTRANVNYYKGKLSLSTNLSMSIEDRDVGSTGMIGYALRYNPFFNQIDPGNTDPIYSNSGDFTTQLNWVAGAFNETNKVHSLRSAANFTFSYDINKYLKLTSHLSLNESNSYTEIYKPYQEIYSIDDKLLTNPRDGSITRISNVNSSLNTDVSLNYIRKFKGHSINLLVVGSSESYKSRGFNAIQYGLFNNYVKNFTGTTLDQSVSEYGDSENRLVGVLGRVLYDWKNKYLFSLSTRTDGSSKFSKAHRWGIFPSYSCAWNVSDERFFNKLKNIVNTLKLRYSHGTTGNQYFASYQFSNYVSSGYDYAFGYTGKENVEIGVTRTTFANPNIRWETTIQDNYGIDLAMLKNKILFTAEYYNTRKKNMLFNVMIPSSGGVYGGSQMIMNIGNMTNKGLELSATIRNVIKKFSYQINTTFSRNSNKITYLPTSDYFIPVDKWSQLTVLAKGYEAGAFFLYKTDGIVDTQEKLVKYKKIVPSAQMGDLIYKDLRGDNSEIPDGKITPSDRVYCGSGTPKYELGLNTKFEYKGFDLMSQWYCSLKNKIINGTKQTTYKYQRATGLISQWSETNPITAVPAYRGESHPNYSNDTDLWVEDGSYVRLKNITLGYSFANNFINKLYLKKMRLFVTAQNLFTITKYSGYSPEIGGGLANKGMDNANYPSSITLTGGFNLTF